MRLTILLLLLLASATAQADIEDFLDVDWSFRYRLQTVDDPVQGDATASTIKNRLSVQTTYSDDWRLFAQYDHVYAFNHRHYNSVAVFRNTSPIPDVQDQELNQFNVTYTGLANWHFALGRQAIKLDNERHIGQIEFWQHDQTFDALSITYADDENWKFHYSYLDKVQRIFGDDANMDLPADDPRIGLISNRPLNQLGHHDLNSHLFNVSYQTESNLLVSGYAYLLENHDIPTASTNTFGVRVSDAFKPGAFRYHYALEYAQQRSAHNNPGSFSPDYSLAELGVQYKSHRFMLSQEQLGEDNNWGFATTLGTNHKFQGWVDLFTGYRAGFGLKDTFITYKGRKGKLRWQAIWHDFQSTKDSISVGQELDLELAYRFTKKWEAKAILANYFADEGFANLPESQEDITSLFFSVAYNL